MAATTSNLEAEKLKLDALLVRQYNLLSVLGGQACKGAAGGGTLDKIEQMRRQLAVSNNSSAADIEGILTIRVLGEGSVSVRDFCVRLKEGSLPLPPIPSHNTVTHTHTHTHCHTTRSTARCGRVCGVGPRWR